MILGRGSPPAYRYIDGVEEKGPICNFQNVSITENYDYSAFFFSSLQIFYVTVNGKSSYIFIIHP